MIAKTKTRGRKRLEITMHDVLDGLEDVASYMSYSSTAGTVEILSIAPVGRTNQPQPEITPLKSVIYPINRELKKSA
jgi:hypothetical protein